MKFVSFFLLPPFLLLISLSLSAQEKSMPMRSSFQEINLSLPTEADTAEIFELVRTANPLKPISTDSARQLLGRALELNQQLNFPDGMATILIEYAACDLYDGNYGSAINLLHKTYQYAQKASMI
jgi:hypothetical protein